jgi:uncharacterized membrane protein
MCHQVRIVLRREFSLTLHLLLLVMSVVWWLPRLDDDFVLWVALDRDLGTALIFYSLVASTIAFIFGQRDAGSAITELQAGTVASRRDVVLARIIGMVVASWIYLSVLVGGMYLVGALHATWGRPDVRALVPYYLWLFFVLPMLVVLGDHSTRAPFLRPILWVVLVSVATWFVQIVMWSPFVTSILDVLPWQGPPPDTVLRDTHQRAELAGVFWQWLIVGAGLIVVAVLALPLLFDS